MPDGLKKRTRLNKKMLYAFKLNTQSTHPFGHSTVLGRTSSELNKYHEVPKNFTYLQSLIIS